MKREHTFARSRSIRRWRYPSVALASTWSLEDWTAFDSTQNFVLQKYRKYFTSPLTSDFEIRRLNSTAHNTMSSFFSFRAHAMCLKLWNAQLLSYKLRALNFPTHSKHKTGFGFVYPFSSFSLRLLLLTVMLSLGCSLCLCLPRTSGDI